ncbi:hypothetical protein [Mangrovimonas xylaniphaga]|uniref:hypothetical protein n=1 Tax=Mangrovimonas xylaniphaga TaxID=1645915 RepID=UPI0006B4CF13|nr:hypothetical protein [Mangrovimonas xylaniphaga]
MKTKQIFTLLLTILFFIACNQNKRIEAFPSTGYKIEIPDWWNVSEIIDANNISGTLPLLDSKKDNISIRSFNKSEFINYENFENWVIKKYGIGQPPDWSLEDRILSTIKTFDFENLGTTYKTKILNNGREVLCCYILIETSTSYIWVNFKSTETTYTRNFKKLDYLMSTFIKIN